MTYSKEFKQQAIKLSDEIGTQKACEQLGLTYFTLGGWRKKENRKRITTVNPGGLPPSIYRERFEAQFSVA